MAIFKLVATHPRYKMDATQPKLDLITKYIARLLSAKSVG